MAQEITITYESGSELCLDIRHCAIGCISNFDTINGNINGPDGYMFTFAGDSRTFEESQEYASEPGVILMPYCIATYMHGDYGSPQIIELALYQDDIWTVYIVGRGRGRLVDRRAFQRRYYRELEKLIIENCYNL